MTFREYRVISAINKATKAQVDSRVSTGQYNITQATKPQELILGTDKLLQYLPEYSEDLINVLLRNLEDREYIVQYTPKDTPDRILVFSSTAKGRIAQKDYPKDVIFAFCRNFFIPVVCTAVFSALFSWLFSL